MCDEVGISMTVEKQSDYYLLKNKDIIQILDGDTKLGTDGDFEIRMPYLSGPDLVGLCNRFGLPTVYGSYSRWMYLDDLLEYCILQNTVSSLLGYLFGLPQFSKHLKDRGRDEIERLHNLCVISAIDAINGVLLFSGKELQRHGAMYEITPIGADVSVAIPSIQSVDNEYVKRMADRAIEEISAGNYDSAITKSRTLLEEVFCYAIEKKGIQPSSKGDIKALYGEVKSLYSMHGNSEMDKRINMLLSGLEKIVSAIAEMRNVSSDSHGVGQRRINIDDHHALLAVNASNTMAEFILSVANKSQ